MIEPDYEEEYKRSDEETLRVSRDAIQEAMINLAGTNIQLESRAFRWALLDEANRVLPPDLYLEDNPEWSLKNCSVPMYVIGSSRAFDIDW